jgi:hypothetical protein
LTVQLYSASATCPSIAPQARSKPTEAPSHPEEAATTLRGRWSSNATLSTPTGWRMRCLAKQPRRLDGGMSLPARMRAYDLRFQYQRVWV